MSATKQRPTWHLRAACATLADPDIMTASESPLMIEQAKRVCARCPLDVRVECLADGVDDRYGIRAGMTYAERVAYLRASRA